MTIEELNAYLLVNSNQYFVGSDIEVDETILLQLVRRAISVYGNYRPLKFNSTMHINRENSFSELSERKVIGIEDICYMNPILGESSVDFKWTWNRDRRSLKSQISGEFYIKVLAMPILADIDYDQYEFLDMVQGLYMMYVGNSRKAFTMGDMPFENDGSELYSDGKELYETTVSNLSESNDSWYLGVS